MPDFTSSIAISRREDNQLPGNIAVRLLDVVMDEVQLKKSSLLNTLETSRTLKHLSSQVIEEPFTG
jgi:hypothetical protein